MSFKSLFHKLFAAAVVVIVGALLIRQERVPEIERLLFDISPKAMSDRIQTQSASVQRGVSGGPNAGPIQARIVEMGLKDGAEKLKFQARYSSDGRLIVLDANFRVATDAVRNPRTQNSLPDSVKLERAKAWLNVLEKAGAWKRPNGAEWKAENYSAGSNTLAFRQERDGVELYPWNTVSLRINSEGDLEHADLSVFQRVSFEGAWEISRGDLLEQFGNGAGVSKIYFLKPVDSTGTGVAIAAYSVQTFGASAQRTVLDAASGKILEQKWVGIR